MFDAFHWISYLTMVYDMYRLDMDFTPIYTKFLKELKIYLKQNQANACIFNNKAGIHYKDCGTYVLEVFQY